MTFSRRKREEGNSLYEMMFAASPDFFVSRNKPRWGFGSYWERFPWRPTLWPKSHGGAYDTVATYRRRQLRSTNNDQFVRRWGLDPCEKTASTCQSGSVTLVDETLQSCSDTKKSFYYEKKKANKARWYTCAPSQSVCPTIVIFPQNCDV